MSDTKVSLCLIAKNEQERILPCINSVSHLVNEIILVDTGSSDETIKIARSAGAKVFLFPWSDDFSKARNYSLEQASGDWVLVLDADEVLAPVTLDEFRLLLTNSQVEGYFLTIHSFQGNGEGFMTDNIVRLFRNKPAYRFSGAIHEQVAPSIIKATGGKGLQSAPLIINHYGYLDTVILKKDKNNRNTRIIKRELKKHPNDPFLLYCLALENLQKNQIKAGVEYLKKALLNMTGAEGYYQDVIITTANGLLSLGSYQVLFNFLARYLPAFPENEDLLICRGLGYLQLKEYNKAAVDLLRSVDLNESKFMPRHKHLCLVGDVCMLAEDYERAEEMYISALSINNKNLSPFLGLINMIKKCEMKVNCHKMSGLFSINHLDSLWRQLVKEHNPSLATVFIILEIYRCFLGETVGSSLSQLVIQLYKLVHFQEFLKKQSFNYLCLTIRELYTCSLMYEKEFHQFFSLGSKAKALIDDLLGLVIKEYCSDISAKSIASFD